MPKLKKKISADFTVVHNYLFRDYNLSISERGLLLTMLSLPDDWDFSIKGLSKIVPDGVTRISTALKNLEKHKYLVRRRIYCDGKISDWEYIFSDEPLDEQDGDNQDTENLDSENLNQVNQDVENPSDNIIYNNKINNNQINNINQSINKNTEIEKTDRLTDITHLTHHLKQQINYRYITATHQELTEHGLLPTTMHSLIITMLQ